MSLPDIRKFSDLIADPNTNLTTPAGDDYHLIYDFSETVDTRKVKVISDANLKGNFSVTFDIGDGINVISATPTRRAQVHIAVACVVTGWEISEVGGTSGSIVVDIWRGSYSNLPLSNANSIAGSQKPTLSSAVKNANNNLSAWTTSVPAGSYIVPEVESASGVKMVAVTLKFARA